jgi:HPt (histidine-containing phosphotransfer) domain-containing protein
MNQENDVIDIPLAISSVGGDIDFLAELALIAEAALPALLGDIQKALRNRDFRTVEEEACLVSETAHNVSAKRVDEAARALKAAAGHVQAVAARHAAGVLEEEISHLKPALETLKALYSAKP